MVLLSVPISFYCYFKTGIVVELKKHLHSSTGVSLWTIKNYCMQNCANNGFIYLLAIFVWEKNQVFLFFVCFCFFSLGRTKNHNMSAQKCISLSFLNLTKNKTIKQTLKLWISDIVRWSSLVVDVSKAICFHVKDKSVLFFNFFYLFLAYL